MSTSKGFKQNNLHKPLLTSWCQLGFVPPAPKEQMRLYRPRTGKVKSKSLKRRIFPGPCGLVCLFGRKLLLFVHLWQPASSIDIRNTLHYPRASTIQHKFSIVNSQFLHGPRAICTMLSFEQFCAVMINFCQLSSILAQF
jgi:hypothetical protein